MKKLFCLFAALLSISLLSGCATTAMSEAQRQKPVASWDDDTLPEAQRKMMTRYTKDTIEAMHHEAKMGNLLMPRLPAEAREAGGQVEFQVVVYGGAPEATVTHVEGGDIFAFSGKRLMAASLRNLVADYSLRDSNFSFMVVINYQYSKLGSSLVTSVY